MANEIVQGLLGNLLQPQQQGPSPADIMAAVTSSNPMAAAMALNTPSMAQVFGRGARGLLGAAGIGQGQMSAEEALAQSMAQADLTTSNGLKQAAQNALTVGNRPLALQLTLQAQQLQAEEQKRAQEQAAQGQQRISVTNLQNSVSQLAMQRNRPEIADAVKAITDPKAIMEVAEPLYKQEGAITPYQQGQLQRYFTPESVQAFVQNPQASALTPRPTAGEEVPTMTPSQRANLYGKFTRESVEAHLADSTQPLVPLPAPVQDLAPVEKVSLLNDQLRKMPTAGRTEEDMAALKRIEDTIPLLGGTNPQAFTVITASLPMLYQTNARAASEIDSFRSRKGIRESIVDWVAKSAGDTASAETKANIQELVDTLRASLTQQRAAEVTRIYNDYKGIVDDRTLNTWYSNQLSDFNIGPENLVNSYIGNP